MKKWLLAIGLSLVLSVSAAAQEGPFSPNFDEQLGLSLMDDRKKLVKLRELAQKLVTEESSKDRPSSFFFMGYVLHHGDGDLPRARWYLDESIRRFEKQWGRNPVAGAPWGWLEKALLEQAQVTGEMDLYAEQIEVWDRVGDLFRHEYGRDIPYLQTFYAWPLMKLGREQEARERLARVADQPDEATRCQLLNSLGALEMETDHPQACYEAFHQLIEQVRNNGWNMSDTYLRNAGEAAGCLLRFDEAERLFLEATEYFSPQSFSNPWWDLATLYLSQARFPEAVDALKKCHEWTHNQEPFLEQQTRAGNQQLSCEVLLQLGMTEHAYKLASGFVDRPDRKGGDSVARDQWEAANLIVFREAALARRNAIQEEMTWTHGWDWWKLLWQQRDLAWSAYIRGQQAASSIVSHGRVMSCLRYQSAHGSILIPNYMRLELATLLGPGTTLAAVDQLEATKFENLELERPYLEAIRFEALARAGRSKEALAMVETLMKTLPPAEVLLRVRVEGRVAQIYQSQGDLKSALPYLQRVMEKAPGTLRTLRLALPVTFASDGSPLAEKVISICRSSPRFEEESGAFRAEISSGGARLLGPDGSVLAQTEMEPLKKGEEPEAKLAEAIHDRFFAAQIDLSQLDPGSLDGVVTGAVQSKQMQEMFFPGSTHPEESPKPEGGL